MPEQTFRPGDRTSLGSDSPTHPHSAYFEDDGKTGYFYALDLNRSENMILDALHINDVVNVSDRDRAPSLSIVWSDDGIKCALLINGYPHATFDFAAKRGRCRNNSPNFSNNPSDRWDGSDHGWLDDAVAWLK